MCCAINNYIMMINCGNPPPPITAIFIQLSILLLSTFTQLFCQSNQAAVFPPTLSSMKLFFSFFFPFLFFHFVAKIT